MAQQAEFMVVEAVVEVMLVVLIKHLEELVAEEQDLVVIHAIVQVQEVLELLTVVAVVADHVHLVELVELVDQEKL